MISSKFLTPSELAETLNVTKTWVYIKTREKGPASIPRTKIGRHLRFELDKVLAWIEKQNNNNIQ
jgi:excisionase family DNA binding protein